MRAHQEQIRYYTGTASLHEVGQFSIWNEVKFTCTNFWTAIVFNEKNTFHLTIDDDKNQSHYVFVFLKTVFAFSLPVIISIEESMKRN